MPGRWLVIHPGAVGDVLLALPALAHLGRLAPGVHRVVAAAPGPAALLAGSPYAEETVALDRLGLHRLFVAEPARAAGDELAAFDAIVSWFGAGDPTYRANFEALDGPRVVIARAAPPPGAGRHASHHLLDTLAPLGSVPEALPLVRLPVGDAERAWTVAWLAERGLARGRAVVLHPGAGSPIKVWPGYAALAGRLQAVGLPVVVVTGPAETASVARWAAEAGLDAMRIARDLPLRRLAALLDAARAFVGNDSGPSHLAAAVGCPTLALFGPTDPALWAPGGPPGACLHVRVLRGTGAPSDPWRALTVEHVMAALPGERAPVPALAG